MSKLNEYLDAREKLDEMIEKDAKEIVNEAFSVFFRNAPDVDVVQWTQYAPYFNDGEACVFSVHDFNFHTGEPLTEEEVEEIDSYPEWDDVPKRNDDAIEELTSLNIDDLLQSVFGDDCMVVATRDGEFKVSDVSHD